MGTTELQRRFNSKKRQKGVMSKPEAQTYLRERAKPLEAKKKPMSVFVDNDVAMFKVAGHMIKAWVEERNGVEVLVMRGSDALIILPNTRNDIHLMVCDYHEEKRK